MKETIESQNADDYGELLVSVVILGQKFETIADLDEALRIKPDDVNAYLIRGMQRRDFDRQYESAIVDFDEALRIKPDFAEAYYERGLTKRNLGRYESELTSIQ